MSNILIILTTFFLILYSFFPKKLFKIILLLTFISLSFFQIKTTRLQTQLEYSGLEKYLIERRQTLSPFIVRYIDPPFFYRIRQNLFSLFKSFPVLSFIGFILFFKKPDKFITFLLITTLLLLSLISPHGRSGPILLTPFIYFFSIYVLRLVKK